MESSTCMKPNTCVIEGLAFTDGGFNTLISRNPESERIIKIITGDRRGEFGVHSYELDKDLATNLIMLLKYYVDNLSEMVTIPCTEVSFIEGKNIIWIEQIYAGEDLSILLKEMSRKEVMEIARRIKVDFIDKVNCRKNIRSDGKLQFGVDLKAANFCVSRYGDLTLVDIFPPLTWNNGKAMVEIFDISPEVYEKDVWKLFQVEGIIANTLAQFARIRIDCWDIFTEELGCPFDLMEYDISSLTEADAYLMRLLACEFAYRNGIEQGILKRFFESTHFEETFSADKLMKLKTELESFKKGEIK